ncbi:uncharacterized protein CTRU02_213407 [Colletotrichum truncatum]|uniref:Uncharacterized protein n=1 Tax=Colletotrichum truncatum TaxID=5467 RepID=A0ACC3YKM0_COLTU|nr:uncharacterized protein CTRU02_13404 [Colletotrichum truncatum]KAF6783414.1 hypothetical protein CTRU02_13404 [Colletotrichum truncatum]
MPSVIERQKSTTTATAASELSSLPNAAVSKTVLARHSTRAFDPQQAVPLNLVEEALQLAQHAPSSTNIQPWRLTLVSGAALHRLTTALTTAFKDGTKLQIPEIPVPFQHYRSELGRHVYGPQGYGISRDDTEGQMAAVKHNFEFYSAPLAGIVAIDKDLSDPDVVSVGMWLQTLVLLLTERGLGTQVSVSPAGYPDIIKRELGIDENLKILCTIGIGYEQEGQQINKLKMPREPWKNNVRIVSE